MKTTIWDIETGPLQEEHLRAMLPQFDPADVKLGNTKDPEKVSSRIEEARANHWDNFRERAALSAVTGRVLAIGLLDYGTGEIVIVSDDDEKALLNHFWNRHVRSDVLHRMIGFNTHHFDLPFLYRRSWIHGIMPPLDVRRGRYWSDDQIDLMQHWMLNDREARISLNNLCKALGLGEKSGSGKDFAALFANDRPAALDYLEHDLHLTAKVAERIFFSSIGIHGGYCNHSETHQR